MVDQGTQRLGRQDLGPMKFERLNLGPFSGVLGLNFQRPCSPTSFDMFGQLGLGQEVLLIGWDSWDWVRVGGTGRDWDRSLFDLSLSQWDRFGTTSVTVPCACTTWYFIKNRFHKSVFFIKNQS